ncbi:MAG: beta-ketoacyl-ACP synthase III [Stenotrophobium sp.]
MTASVYITRAAAYLPNPPVDNDQIEKILGQVGGRPSRARAIVLRSNGIRQRHYVIDPGTGAITHSNARLTAEAVRGLLHENFTLDDIQVLACGTSSPDQILPNHAVMVHGELRNPPCEVMTASGICVSGVMSLKYGFMSILAGLSDNAVVTGSEAASTAMRACNFEVESEARVAAMEKNPGLAFEKDFLRWMLSDGAGALLLQNRPNALGLSLKVEWIDQFSYANEMQSCMYAGAEKNADGSLTGWREMPSQELMRRSVLSLKQDVRLLDEGIRECTRRGFLDMQKRRGLQCADVDWLLPHYSSQFFREPLMEALPVDLKIPYERWFTNLVTKGNVGAASMYLMIEELFGSGRLNVGERILCYVPESGRFSTAFVYLRVVAG